MSCPLYVTALASQIWSDLGQPPDQPVSYIQTKLVSPSYVGQLSNLTSDCLVSVSGVIAPELDEAQQGLYRLMYEKDFYTTKMNQAMAGLAPGNGAIELVEGDSRIRLVNPVEMAKVYKEMQRQLMEQLQYAVATYRIDRCLPDSVIFPTIINLAGSSWTYTTIPAAGGAQNYYRN